VPAGHNPYNLGNGRSLISVSQGEIHVASGDGQEFYCFQARIRKKPSNEGAGIIRGHRDIISMVIEGNVGILQQDPSVRSPRFHDFSEIGNPHVFPFHQICYHDILKRCIHQENPEQIKRDTLFDVRINHQNLLHISACYSFMNRGLTRQHTSWPLVVHQTCSALGSGSP
jgi:hypothetical protein